MMRASATNCFGPAPAFCFQRRRRVQREHSRWIASRLTLRSFGSRRSSPATSSATAGFSSLPVSSCARRAQGGPMLRCSITRTLDDRAAGAIVVGERRCRRRVSAVDRAVSRFEGLSGNRRQALLPEFVMASPKRWPSSRMNHRCRWMGGHFETETRCFRLSDAGHSQVHERPTVAGTGTRPCHDYAWVRRK